MPHLSIKNVPEWVVEKLRQRAARHHRSLQGELMALVEQAVESESPAAAPTAPSVGGRKTIEQIAAEHRARWSEPFARSPRAVDVIRAERDAR